MFLQGQKIRQDQDRATFGTCIISSIFGEARHTFSY